MAALTKLKSGSWRAQVRRKGRYVGETFRRHEDAKRWAIEAERQIDRGETPESSRISRIRTFGQLIDLHIEDMSAVNRAPRRSKAATLSLLKRQLGSCNMLQLDRERLIRFGRQRADQGAGPVTLGIDVGMVKLVLTHAAAIHGLTVRPDQIDLARIALKRLGLIGQGRERDRRPSQEELDALISGFENNPRQLTPIGRIIRFAVATGMRQDEIMRVVWQDVDVRTRMLTIRDRKDPREKKGNDQRIPLFAACGYDGWAILEEQRLASSNQDGRIFPYNGRSVGTVFHRACDQLEIIDLNFHDLRHEATSRLFEAGLAIEQVALVTGHKDWKMLKRYTHLKPEALHSLFQPRAA